MSGISLFTPVVYPKSAPLAQKALEGLSHYFSLGGQRARVIRGDQVELEPGSISCAVQALKVASYVLFSPITVPLFAVYLCLRSRHHFTVISLPPKGETPAVPPPVVVEPIARTLRREDVVHAPHQDTVVRAPHEDTVVPRPLPVPLEPGLGQAAARVESIRSTTLPVPPKERYSLEVKRVGTGADERFEMDSEEDMRQLVRKLSNEVVRKHCPCLLELPGNRQGKETEKFLEELKKVVDVVDAPAWGGPRYFIKPKRKEEKREDGTIVRTYHDNQVVEIVRTEANDWKGSWTGCRKYPDGTVENGEFCHFQLKKGERTERGVTTYLSPTLLLSNPVSGRAVLCTQANKLIVVERVSDRDIASEMMGVIGNYVQAKEELISELARLFTDPFFKTSENALREFFKGLDGAQHARLWDENMVFCLKPAHLQILLEVVQEKGLVVNLRKVNPETGETVLSLCGDHTKVVELLIALDPDGMQTKSDGASPLISALLSGNQDAVSRVVQEREKKGILSDAREKLFDRICFFSFLGEPEVTCAELDSLSPRDKDIAYKLANIYSQLPTLRNINRKECRGVVELPSESELPKSPSVVRWNMDALKMQEAVELFLKDLGAEGLVLKKSEAKYNSSFDRTEELEADMGNVLAAHYLRKTAEKLGLAQVSVERVGIFVDDKKENLELRVTQDLNLVSPNKGGKIRVFRENVEPVKNRGATLTMAQMKELLQLFEATELFPYRSRVVITDEGPCVVKVSFSNFGIDPLQVCESTGAKHYDAMISMIETLTSQYWDRPGQSALIQEYQAKKKQYCQTTDAERAERRRDQAAQVRKCVQQTGCDRGLVLRFPIKDLLPSP